MVGLGVMALAALSVGGVLAQPTNDNFTSATQLGFGASGNLPGNNLGATRQAGEPLIVNNAGGASVWYSWTAPFDGIATFNTTGSSFDTLLGVYVGTSVDSLTTVAQDNNSGGNLTSKVTFNAPAGTRFYISVDGSNGVQGNIALNWTMSFPSQAGSNDTLAQATVLSGNSGTLFDYNFFATAEPFETDPFSPVVFGRNSMWYTWTAPSDGVLTVDTIGSSFDTLLDIYTGTGAPALAVRNENDDFIGRKTSQISMLVTAGTVYRISVNGYNFAEGFIRLDWNFTPPPANDNFASATALDSISTGGSITGNNMGATAETGEPFHAGFAVGQSVWYKWVAPQDGEVEMDTIGSSFDTLLGVYSGTSVSMLSQMAANDDLFPTYGQMGVGQTAQMNYVAQPTDNQAVPPSPFELVIPVGPVPLPNFIFGETDYILNLPYSGLPGVTFNGSGASGLRFNAKAGATYYIAVSGKSGTGGQFSLSWGYHSSGVFKFASENRDQTTGIPIKTGIVTTGGITTIVSSSSGYPGMLLYQTAETEEFGYRSGTVAGLIC